MRFIFLYINIISVVVGIAGMMYLLFRFNRGTERPSVSQGVHIDCIDHVY